jgi:hypothetical protein
MKEINFFFKSPLFFISMATAAKFVLLILIFLAYLVSLDVDVTGNAVAMETKKGGLIFFWDSFHQTS